MKRIGLIDIDSKMANLALMKLSSYHKTMGNKVELAAPLFAKNYDRVYASKIYSYSHLPTLPSNAGIGGSGVDLGLKLSPCIESIMPDYTLYRDIDYSLGFTTRGCSRRCRFCVVPQKEGKLIRVASIYEFWNPAHKKIILLDNNILGLSSHFMQVAEDLLLNKIKVDFTQGLDIRYLNDDNTKILRQLSFFQDIKFSFDRLSYETGFRRGAELLLKYQFSKTHVTIYVLAGYDENFESTLQRIEIILEYGFAPYIMLYRSKSGERTSDQRFLDLMLWSNKKQRLRSFSFADFNRKFRRKDNYISPAQMQIKEDL